MKKLSHSIFLFFCFTSFIESCELKKNPTATHALYSQTTYFISCFSSTTEKKAVPISELLSKTAFVFKRSKTTKFERAGLLTYSYSITSLEAIIYSDGSQDLFTCTENHQNKPVAKWPTFKGDQIEFQSSFN